MRLRASSSRERGEEEGRKERIEDEWRRKSEMRLEGEGEGDKLREAVAVTSSCRT